MPLRLHRIPGVPGMTGEALAAMNPKELEALMLENGFHEHRQCYRANPDFLLREIAGEPLLMPTGSAMSGMMLPLNDTGAFIWRQLQTPCTVQDVIFAAREEYEDNEGTLEEHVRGFIQECVQSGLVLKEE